VYGLENAETGDHTGQFEVAVGQGPGWVGGCCQMCLYKVREGGAEDGWANGPGVVCEPKLPITVLGSVDGSDKVWTTGH
jgi:hypothetical protein